MPFRPESIIVLDAPQASYEAWEPLAGRGEQPAHAVWKSPQKCLSRLRADAQWGEVIPKDSIPTYFRERYGVSNLYGMDLAAFHHSFHTIANRAVILLDVVDLPTYDQWFPGNRRRSPTRASPEVLSSVRGEGFEPTNSYETRP
jgi:hypothetical protein